MEPKDSEWNGRLALSIASDPPQAFSGSFVLTGTAQQGDMQLLSPLGTSVAKMQWQPGSATLSDGAHIRPFASLEQLAEAATGAPLPVEALFAWLKGERAVVPGWEADTSALAEGKLVARRAFPAPPITLRIQLDH